MKGEKGKFAIVKWDQNMACSPRGVCSWWVCQQFWCRLQVAETQSGPCHKGSTTPVRSRYLNAPESSETRTRPHPVLPGHGPPPPSLRRPPAAAPCRGAEGRAPPRPRGPGPAQPGAVAAAGRAPEPGGNGRGRAPAPQRRGRWGTCEGRPAARCGPWCAGRAVVVDPSRVGVSPTSKKF